MNVETIRRISIQADTQGFPAAVSSADSLTAAQDRLAASSNTVATVTDISTRRALSAEAAYQRQTLSVVDGARAQDQMARALKVADAAMQQGIITRAEHAQRVELITQKYSAATPILGGFGSSLAGITGLLGSFGIALSVGAVVGFGERLFAATAGIENQAKVLGISTDALQAYHAAAVLSGAGADVGDEAIRRFTRSIGDANDGNKALQKEFTNLLDVTSNMAGGTEAWLPKVANALLSISDASTRASDEAKLFGRSGQDVEEVLKQWADPNIVKNMTDQGYVLDHNLVDAFHHAETAASTFFMRLTVDGVKAFGDLTPYVENLITLLNADWTKLSTYTTPASVQTADRLAKEFRDQWLADAINTPTVAPDAGGYRLGPGGVPVTWNKSTKTPYEDYLDKINAANAGAQVAVTGSALRPFGPGFSDNYSGAAFASPYQRQSWLQPSGAGPMDVTGAIQGVLGSNPLKVQSNEVRDFQNSIIDGAKTAAGKWGDSFEQMSKATTDTLNLAADAVANFVTTGKFAFGDFARSVLADFAKIESQQLIMGLVGSILGGGFNPSEISVSGLNPGLAGARAGGGPVSGGSTYLVGEHGPEYFTPSSSGSITPNGASRAGTTINIDARGAQEGVADQIVKAIAAAAPHIVGASVKTVNKNLPGMIVKVNRDKL